MIKFSVLKTTGYVNRKPPVVDVWAVSVNGGCYCDCADTYIAWEGSKAEAIVELETFIADAHTALEQLKALS